MELITLHISAVHEEMVNHGNASIGTDTSDKKLEYFSRYSEGKMAILDYKNITYTVTILSKLQEMLKDINQLCYNIKNICANRDEVLANMKGLNITLGHFKRLTSYLTVKDEEHFTGAF